MENFKRGFITAIMSIAIIFSSISATVFSVHADDNSFVAGGWFETIYAEWNDTAPKLATIEYKKSESSSYSSVDTELIRSYDGKGRVDIVGLEKGSYDLKITTQGGVQYYKENISVKEHDRTGYAHKDYPQGVGAYKNDGTIKDNAIVVYVNEENKNTVTVPGYESYGTGIGWLLNNNQAFVTKLGDDNRPLVVRIIGTVYPPDGLTVPASIENGGNVQDNGMMCIIKGSKNVTVEGIGDDAIVDGWGFSFFVGDGYKNYESYEVRNLNFRNYPEDALGFQGYQEGKSISNAKLTYPIEHVWVHNNSFDVGFCANPTESDKSEGDGSCDFKRGQYFTMDYNYYKDCHKTNLVGASDSNLQYNITFHHNFYENCASRGPLARQANIHIYNSYFKGNTSKTIDARANSYILAEGIFFDSCKNPVTTASGAVVKSYNNIFYNTSENRHETEVSDKSQTVESANKYDNFDTKADFYEYTATSPMQAKADCIAFSGVMKKSSEIVESAQPTPVFSVEPENAVKLPFNVVFDDASSTDYFGKKLADRNIKQIDSTASLNIDDVIYKTAGKYSQTGTDFKIKDTGLTFKLDRKAIVGIKSTSKAQPAVLYTQEGKSVLSAFNATVYGVVDAGTYSIQSGLMDKEAYLSFVSIKEYVDGDKVPEDETIETTTKEGTTESTTDDDNGSDDDDDTPSADGVYVLDYTNNINTGSYYNAVGKTKSKTLTHNGKKYTKALSMESATNLQFKMKKKGTLTLVVSSTDSAPKVKIDGVERTIPSQGDVSFELNSGSHSITKSTKNTYIFVAMVSEDGFEFNGDIDGDGNVTFNDAAMLLNYVLDKNKNPLTASQLAAARIEKDNYEITALNVAYIIQYVLDNQ